MVKQSLHQTVSEPDILLVQLGCASSTEVGLSAIANKKYEHGQIVPLPGNLLKIAQALGTTLALMMSIAALSVPEMLILHNVIHCKALGLYAAVLAVAFTLVGRGFN